MEWLENSHPITDIELGLARISQVANQLNLIKPKVPVISVAGTNGKGSVIATLESLADCHQLAIGSYTSPHLIRFNERIKLNGLSISDAELCVAFSYIANRKGDIELTYFEFTTLVALYCFSKQKLDFIALEVGLGGRFDAINIVNADVAVITSIGLDHTDWLGDTLEEIAYEKAGIARSGNPLVVADKQLLPLLDKALQELSPTMVAENTDYQVNCHSAHWDYLSESINIESISNSSLFVKNQAAALSAFLLLFPEKKEQAHIRQALEKSSLVGRFSKLADSPLIILDVAHNPDSALLLNKKLKKLKKTSEVANIWAICGMLKDKDIRTSLSHMEVIDNWICIDLDSPRGATAKELDKSLVDTFNAVRVRNLKNVAEAYEYFADNSEPGDLLVVFGSFVTVGLMIEYWDKNHLVKDGM